MSARQELVDLLVPALPDEWDVYPYPATIDAIEAGTTVLLVEGYAEQAEPIRGLRAHTLNLALVVAYVTSPDGDDALDVAWDVLRPVLDDLAGVALIHWTDATRATFVNTYPSLAVPVTMKTKD